MIPRRSVSEDVLQKVKPIEMIRAFKLFIYMNNLDA